MPETGYNTPIFEKFQSVLGQYEENSDVVTEAIQNRNAYETVFQAGEALKKNLTLIEAAEAENTLRDLLPQAQKESAELIQKYMNERRYSDASNILNQLMNAQSIIDGPSNADIVKISGIDCEIENKEAVVKIRIYTNGRLVLRGSEQLLFPPLLYRLLCRLAENAGDAVSIEELADAGWPGEMYSKNKIMINDRITQTIVRMRSIFGPSAESYIQNRHGYGYVLQHVQIFS